MKKTSANAPVSSSWTTPALHTELPLIPFENLPSANPIEALSLAHRMDPYWGNLWGRSSKASWVDVETARAQAAQGFAKVPRYLHLAPMEAAAKLADVSHLSPKLDVLAILDSWRTTTAEQLAAFTGHKAIAHGRSSTMTGLFSSGLVDVGVFSNALINTRTSTQGTLYRGSAGEAFESKVAPLLTYPEWVSVTAGLKHQIGGGQHDRHNILTVELALRIAEICDIAAVVGEKLSLIELLAYTGLGIPAKPIPENSAADFTAIRHDGLRIAFEVTATITAGLRRKVARWCELLSERRINDSGLIVAFVLADKQSPSSDAFGVRNALHKIIREEARNCPGFAFDRVASKLFILDWREVFPEPGVVSPAFFTLEGARPTGPAGALWERASLLDEDAVPFKPRSMWAEAALDNFALLRSVPYWLREGRTPPEMWKVLLAASGRTSIPRLQLDQDESRPTRPFGEAFGVADAALPPRRLRSSLNQKRD
jgi:hypothetical protein